MRQRSPFKTLDSVKKEIGERATTGLAVNSSYFEVRGRIRLGDRVLEQTSLVFRHNRTQVDVMYRDQVSSRDQPAS
jgi:general secretion pathway protein K